MNEASESEIKYIITAEDAASVIADHKVIKSGEKIITYYEDEFGKLSQLRGTFRRVLKSGALVDELKTLVSWTTELRQCLEQTSLARVPGVPDALASSDIEPRLASTVRSLLGCDGDFVLRKAETLRVHRSVIEVPGLDKHIEIDVCHCDDGEDFYELEYEPSNSADAALARELLPLKCPSAVESKISKRERARAHANRSHS